MRVLIGSDSAALIGRFQRILGSLGHEVVVVKSPDQLAATLRSGPKPDVAVVSLPDDPWMEPLRSSEGYIYVIAALRELNGRTTQRAWDAGVDDITKLTACAEEIAGRVGALDRIRSWVGKMGEGFAHAMFDPEQLATVQEVNTLLADEMGQMIMTSLESKQISSLPELVYAAEIPLSLTEEEVEITLGIGVEASVAATLSETLFGEAVGAEIMSDSMREFANAAGGAFKRAALVEGKTFSIGLPTDAMVAAPRSDCRVWVMQGENGMRLVAWMSTRSEQPRRINAGDLREGMVVVKPVHNGAGILLVPAGTVLTERTVNRLIQMMGRGALVEVARAA